MIEIKFITSEGEKKIAVISPEVASTIADALSLVADDGPLADTFVSYVKQSDISDYSYRKDSQDPDKEYAFYKGVIKYETLEGKTAKYAYLVYASDTDEAIAELKNIIEQTSMQFAELCEVKKSSYTDIIDLDWI